MSAFTLQIMINSIGSSFIYRTAVKEKSQSDSNIVKQMKKKRIVSVVVHILASVSAGLKQV